MQLPAGSLERITNLLNEAQQGSAEALQQVMEAVHPELIRLARRRLRRFRHQPGTPTLEPAALVNETYLKLIRQRSRFDSSGHFLAISSRLMLRVLLDYERGKLRRKRGGGMVRVSLSEAMPELAVEAGNTVERFAESLQGLDKLNPRAAEIVKARVLWGLSVPEIAASFELSSRTVERDWQFAQRWLEREMTRAQAPA